MDKSIKLAPVIILFVFLFFITEEVATTTIPSISGRLIPTPVKCTSSKDCPVMVIRPHYIMSVCQNGYCAKVVLYIGKNDYQ
jgi:hypothetical protein